MSHASEQSGGTDSLNAKKVSEGEQERAALTAELRDKDRIISSLSAQLAHSERELEGITSTPAWRLLKWYGKIKYRYLLPVYRLLGLLPFVKGSRPVNSADSRFAQLGAEPLHAGIFGTPGKSQSKVADPNSYDIVCFPIIEWDFRFQRPQQLMLRFAAAGHRVFYLSQTFRTTGESFTIVERSHNLFEVSLYGPPRNIYTEAMSDRVRAALFDSLDQLRRNLTLGETLAIVQLPFWWPLVQRTRAEFDWPIIYDCMDQHAGFSMNRRSMIRQESELMKSADLIVASSSILESAAKLHNSNVVLVRNGCDFEHFSRTKWRKGERPVIGYYGAIQDWFNSDLVADLAERRPDWDFVLVGSTMSADTRRLARLANVSMPGEKHYSVIPDWLGSFDVVILPFKRMPLTEATNPVKAYEILASGKPLVSVPIPEMASLAPLVRLASTVDEFEREIVDALGGDTDDLIERRRAFAKEHKWEDRFEVLSSAIRLTFPQAPIEDKTVADITR